MFTLICFVIFNCFQFHLAVEVIQLTPPDNKLAVAPHWDCRQQAVFWVDVDGRTINRYELQNGHYTYTHVEGQPSFIIPIEGCCDRYVISLGRRIVVIYWDGEQYSQVRYLREIAEVDQMRPNNNLAGGKADPCGRLFTGTTQFNEDGSLNYYESSLFRLDGRITNVEQAISFAIGLAWDCQDDLMYFIDSPEKRIRMYDYCFDTGCMSNKRYVFDMNRYNLQGVPGGCTIDNRGNLWVALNGGSAIINVDPCCNRLIQTIELPVQEVTGCTFGGPNRDLLFVTTSASEDQSPQAGAIFLIAGLGVKGTVNNNFQLASCCC